MDKEEKMYRTRPRINPTEIFSIQRRLTVQQMEEAVRFEAYNMFTSATALEEFLEKPSARVFAAIRTQHNGKSLSPADTVEFAALADTSPDSALIPQAQVLGVLLAEIRKSRRLSVKVSHLQSFAYPTNDGDILEILVSGELVSAWQKMLAPEGLAQLRVNVPFEDTKSEVFYTDAGFMRHYFNGKPTAGMVWPMDY